MEFQPHIWAELSADEQAELLRRPALAFDASIRSAVRKILDQVRLRGDSALREFTKEFDGIELESFEVSEAEHRQAEARLTVAQIEAIDVAIENVRCFHEQQLTTPIDIETSPGVRCQRVNHPIDSVGLYVPAGSAPLPSTALMLAVPAVIADCPERILCTPSQADGCADAGVLVAARRAGLSRIFKIGGAQAIAAMAYGTESVPRVEKVFGPGNAWVTAAKTEIASDPGGAAIDMPAGPSEVLVIADELANPDFVASDLLSQAEHGVDSQVVLVCTSTNNAEAIAKSINQQLPELSRRSIVAESLKHCRIIIVNTAANAVLVSNRYAPEHLVIHTSEPRELLRSVRNAGSVFLGQWSPESVGDYCSGTNHVLPTYGAAKSYSGLGVNQFMRQMTVQELTRGGLSGLAQTIVELATMEGLDGHANAVRYRLDSGKDMP